MKFLVTMTALAASFGTASVSTSASAQTYVVRNAPAAVERAPFYRVSDMSGPALPPYEVVTIVRSMGFDPASRPVLRGPVWVVQAFDNQDVLVRVAVDARTGRVVNVAEARRVSAYGGPEVERYGSAYPVPPAPVPRGGTVYEETETTTTTVGPQARAYPEESYDERVNPARDYPPGNYRPAPYVPSPSVAPRASAPHPKVAARTPAAVKPAAPKPAVHAVTPAPKTAAAPAGKDQSKPQQQQQAASPVATQDLAKAAAERPGISIPAPVAHKAEPAPAASDTAPAENKTPAAAKADDLKLVPVAPLE